MNDTIRHCFALDLKDDPQLIAEYDAYHKNGRPEVLKSIKDSGITSMDIYRVGNRLFMIMEVTDDFSFAIKSLADESNEKVQEWEKLMWKYQQALPFVKPGEKWVAMNKIFSL
jgi:L-rhamnose mutarotase